MKKKWLACILAATMTVSMAACGKTNTGADVPATSTGAGAVTSVAESDSSVTEEVTAGPDKEEEKTTADKKKPEEKSTVSAEVLSPEGEGKQETVSQGLVNNNGFFVMYEGNIFCHVPDEAGMNKTALWGEFLANPSTAENVLLQIDAATGEAKVVSHDYAYGKMAVSGAYLTYRMLAQYDFVSGPTEGVVFYELPGHETHSEEPWSDGISAGGDKDGHYVVTYQYKSDEEADGNGGYFLYPYKDGKELGAIYAGRDIYPVGIDGNQFVVREILYDYSETYPRFIGEELIQYNLDDGSLCSLGKLPVFEEGYPNVDQAVIENGKVYMTYSRYDGGTMSFYCDTLLVAATLGQEDSVVWSKGEDHVSEYGESDRAKAFYVKGKDVEFCDGEPGTAAVVGNDIGYYDENGRFVKVASGYAAITDNEGEEMKDKIEIAEKVGDYIYAVRNSLIHVPSEDVGWRMAYKRNDTQVIRISIATGKEEVLYYIYR